MTSNKARQLGYQQSLFGRLHSFLTGGCHIDQDNAGSTPPMANVRCPVLRLETQFRMHPDIALWPNRFDSRKQDAVFKGSDCIDSDFDALSAL